MMRMGEYLEKTTPSGPQMDTGVRHPLLTDEIEPLRGGMWGDWSDDVGEIPIYLWIED